jgi:hypothetical protein
VRDGEKGPLLTEVAWTLVQAKCEGKVSDVAESLLVFREQQPDGGFNADFHGAKWPNTAGPFSLVIGPNGAASR